MRLLSTSAILAYAILSTCPAHAAIAPSQVRVAISPGSTDAVWSTSGIKFEKAVDCKVIKSTSTSPANPAAADVISTGSAKAPLFNPGLPNPDGTYNLAVRTSDNTIYVPLDLAVDPKSYVGCMGRILANGADVTASTRSGLVYATINQIAGTGPVGVSPVLDKAKLPTPQVDKQGSFTLIHHFSQNLQLRGPINSFDIETATVRLPTDPLSDFLPAYGNLVPQITVQARTGTKFSNGYFPSPNSADYAGCSKSVFDTLQFPFTQSSLNANTVCFKTSGGKLGKLTATSAAKKQTGTIVYNGTTYQEYSLEFTFAYTVWK